MRKFLLFLFLICAEMTFAQEKGEISFPHSCFKQLEVTVKNYGYLKDNQAYGWGIKIKNNYKVPVSFTYSLTVGDEKSGNGQPTYVIDPGKTWSNDWGRLGLLLKKSNSDEFQVRIWGLCFKGYDCSDENYFDCDGKQIKDKYFGSNWRTKNNQNNSQTNSSNKNNYNTVTDLVNRLNELCPQLGNLANGTNNSIYTSICNSKTYTANDVNLLKSHIMQLENEITLLQNSNSHKQIQQQQKQQLLQQQKIQQAQQAEQQRIAQENARRAEEERQKKIQQQQQYNNSVNQAQTNMQNGNYSGAMQGYANAASSAGSKSEKQLATGGAIISGLTGLAAIWQKSSEEKQERKLQEAEAERKKAQDDAKKAEDERKKKEDEQKIKEEEYKGSFEMYKPSPLDYIIKDTVTIQSVIYNHIIAIGGLEKLKAVKNITKSTESKNLLTETYYKNKSITAYGKFVWNTTYSNGINSSKTVFDGVTGYRESNNKKTNLDSESIAAYKNTQPIDIFKLQQNVDLELGKQMLLFDTEACYVIIERSKYKEYNYVKKYYFSRDTGLWSGVENLTTGPNNYSSTSYTLYKDYREVDGILFSFTQRTFYQYPGLNSEYHYGLSGTETTEIKINKSLRDKDFE